MNWFIFMWQLVYGVAFVGCLVFAWRLARGSWASAAAQWPGWLLASLSLFGGILLAAAASPDWSPITMLVLAVPWWPVTVWASRYATLVKRGIPAEARNRKALLFTAPMLLLAPLGVFVAGALWLPLVAVAATLLYTKRPHAQTAAVQAAYSEHA